MSGGKGGSSSSGLHDYYASFVGIVQYGLVDELVALVVDDEDIWRPAEPVKRVNSSNPYEFMIEGRGKVYFYWGTDDQVLSDPVSSKPGRGHSPYRRKAIAAFEDFLCGRERTSAPDVSFITRRQPRQTVISSTYNTLDTQGQANGFAALLDFMTDDVAGLGMSNDLFDVATWEAQAAKIFNNQSDEYLTINLNAKTRLKNLITEFNGYYDTWFRQNFNGQIEVGSFRDEGTIHVVTSDDLVDGTEPSFGGTSTIDSDGRLILEFVNRNLAFNTDHAGFNNPARIRSVDRADPVDIQRPWIRRASQAARHVVREGYRMSLPYHEFTLNIREERADDLIPGELIAHTIDVAGLTLIARVVKRRGDSSDGGNVQITCETMRVASEFGSGSIEDVVIEVEESDPSDLDYWMVVQMPTGFSGDDYQVAVIASSTRGLDVGARVHYKQQSSVDYVEAGTFSTFAVAVEIDSNTTVAATTINIVELTSPEPRGFNSLPTNQTAEEIANDNLLLLVQNGSGVLEIMTVKTIVATANGYDVNVNRGRRGTDAITLQTGTIAYIIQRTAIRTFTSSTFELLSEPLNFKVTPYGGGELALADATEKTITIDEVPQAVPISVTAITSSGVAPLIAEIQILGDETINYTVNWNDGSAADTSNGITPPENATHEYTLAGDYNAVVNITTTSTGETRTFTIPITVT